ncbi:hypothetical protein WMY93_024400 [Mugilogobius chulae]|uniref:BTB domain-containing protein n=1 Tax=Mugilogobius chulae TaxID=88201 RepID=A0AAW0N4B9_9GOBI
MSLVTGVLEPTLTIETQTDFYVSLKMSRQTQVIPKHTRVYEELWHKKIFCDAVLKVEDVEFPVHKIILCGASDFFRAMFVNWGNHSEKNFQLGGVSAEILSLLLEWICNKPAGLLSTDNVQDVILAADMLLLEDLVELSFDFMLSHMSAENCIGIWKFSAVVVSTRIRDAARRFILHNFEQLSVCEEFYDLTAQELLDFIGEDQLNIKNESDVYQAVVRWVNHDHPRRRGEFSQLLAKVRFSQISEDFLQHHIFTNPMMYTDFECVNTVARITPARPRLPAAILLAIGGWSGGDPTNCIEAYDYNADCWINVTNNEERPRAYHGSVFLNGSVYCVGGFDRIEHFNSMRRLDLATRTWHEMPPMYSRRCYISVVVLNGCIYAMGGYNGTRRQNTAEVYNPQTNQWSLIAPMNEQRSDASCATLNGKIYICGGFNGTEVLQTAECYDPQTNEWTMITPMTVRRSGVAAVTYHNRIYAVGGFDGVERLRSVECYNTRTNSWQPVASMITTRSNFGIEVLNDRIFVAGGYNGFTTTYNAESYDRLTDTWSDVCDMDVFRSALNCCVIYGLTNMADYTIPRDALTAFVSYDTDEEST